MHSVVTRRGRVTVPKAIRDYLGLQTGSAVTFERLSSGEVVLRTPGARAESSAGVVIKLRSRATVRMKTEEIMALTRGE